MYDYVIMYKYQPIPHFLDMWHISGQLQHKIDMRVYLIGCGPLLKKQELITTA